MSGEGEGMERPSEAIEKLRQGGCDTFDRHHLYEYITKLEARLAAEKDRAEVADEAFEAGFNHGVIEMGGGRKVGGEVRKAEWFKAMGWEIPK